MSYLLMGYQRGVVMIAHPTWVEINLDQFRKNIRLIKNFITPTKYCLPIKSNAYGHGICEIARAAQDEGIDYLAVASLSEGIKLRENQIHLPILVLGSFHQEQILDLVRYNLEFSISSAFKVGLVEEKLKNQLKKALVHLKVDTGLRRVGARPETAEGIYEKLLSSQCIELRGIYSHLAHAETPNHSYSEYQFHLFRTFLEKIKAKNILFHISNSAGMVHLPLDFQQMVRPGLLSFGLSTYKLPVSLREIESCFSLKSKVSYFKVVEKDQGIGYGHTYYTSKQTRIVTIPIGYGDGYRRALSNKGSVLIRGKKYPIAGTISMDQLTVDIGDGEAYVDDEVVLIGKQGDQEITIFEIAQLCDTIPYEILCGFNERVPRIYKSNLLTANFNIPKLKHVSSHNI